MYSKPLPATQCTNNPLLSLNPVPRTSNASEKTGAKISTQHSNTKSTKTQRRVENGLLAQYGLNGRNLLRKPLHLGMRCWRRNFLGKKMRPIRGSILTSKRPFKLLLRERECEERAYYMAFEGMLIIDMIKLT